MTVCSQDFEKDFADEDAVDEDTVFNICRIQFALQGIAVKFPKNTPKKLTYQWRMIKSITKKFKKWEFGVEEIKVFVKVAAITLSQSGDTSKGLAVLYEQEIMDKCYRLSLEEEEKTDGRIAELRSSLEYVNRMRDERNLFDFLKGRNRAGSISRISLYYQSGKIGMPYISTSRTCAMVLNWLKENRPKDRLMCPSDAEIYVYAKEISEKRNHDLRKILGSDFKF